MTERSPIPACLSHLTQRDAAVRARALEEAAQIADRFTCGGCGMDGKTGIAIRAMMQVPKEVTVVRRDIPTPPAPTPDKAAIRAELVTALRGVMALVPNISHCCPRPTFGAIYPAMQRAHAALARADTMDQALTRDVPSSPGITHEL